jgi:hypothetical protein
MRRLSNLGQANQTIQGHSEICEDLVCSQTVTNRAQPWPAQRCPPRIAEQRTICRHPKPSTQKRDKHNIPSTNSAIIIIYSLLGRSRGTWKPTKAYLLRPLTSSRLGHDDTVSWSNRATGGPRALCTRHLLCLLSSTPKKSEKTLNGKFQKAKETALWSPSSQYY